MKEIIVKIQQINPDLSSFSLPALQTEGSAGMDLHSAIKCTIKPGERVLIPTNFSLEIPSGYEAQLRARSGLALKYGLILPNAPATIDSDYRGEIKIILANIGSEEVTIEPGERIAQMIFAEVVRAELLLVDELNQTERGAGGFGHTGI